MRTNVLLLFSAATLALAACTAPPTRDEPKAMSSPLAAQHHDDLLTGGLGIDGLRNPVPPGFAIPATPTAEELRRRALWTNWRGIADLAPGGGYGEVYGSLAPVPGREFHALRRLPQALQPHRVMAQIPDAFDAKARCLLVTASSGSRGIYGAIALAGAWGLPRGCAVVYTDKGAGTDWIELGTAERHGPDGTLGAHDAAAFAPASAGSATMRVAYKHAHSQDNPEADWGRHVRQAAEFGLEALNQAFPQQAPFSFDNTRVIAAGLSNGAGAVLRAAEIDGTDSEKHWLDGAVAIAPNVLPGEGGRQLYDYATEAAIYMPCALLHPRFDAVAMARPGGAKPPAWLARCASLRAAGLLDGDTPEAQAQQVYARLISSGWNDAALEAAALSTSLDLWRGLAVGYASAYTRSPADAMPCGYAYAALDAQGQARAATVEERAGWWSDTSGIAPAAGVGVIDTLADVHGSTSVPGGRMPGGTGKDDAALPGLQCLRALWDSGGASSLRLHASIDATRAALPRAGLPLIVVHGADDGLVPEAFSGGAYAAWVQAQGGDLSYWKIANAQHFDAFLGLPHYATRYVPLLPYAYRALDAMWAQVVEGTDLPASADILTQRRKLDTNGIAPLTREHLALPKRR